MKTHERRLALATRVSQGIDESIAQALAERGAQVSKGSYLVKTLFEPFSVKNLNLPNRIVMAPMTRAMSPKGVPGADVAEYYGRRAKSGVGLIISEGTFVPHPSASHEKNAPRFHGDDALKGWKRVIDAVHAAGGRMFPQLWHVGQVHKPPVKGAAGVFDEDSNASERVGPSGIFGKDGTFQKLGRPATSRDISDIVEAFAQAAASAQKLGFDGIEIHGAHGYLIDQFLWGQTNLRDDDYGGDLKRRGRFALEIVSEIRKRVGPDFPIALRLSQWKQQDYSAKLASTPEEWERIVTPLADAGVDIFHLSQRRFWEGEFGSGLNLAGWTKKLTGRPTITVGSISLDNSVMEMMQGQGSSPENNLAPLLSGIEQGHFDMVAIGRAMIANPDWPERIRSGTPLKPYSIEMLKTLD
jgi:2,4-dienoyl-CoA reductase-like NADH-dependent reductase (Old Yellow Enzyme family)